MSGLRYRADHRFADENMSAYIDGRLSTHEATRLEGHVAQCGACRTNLATLRQTKSLLHHAPVLTVPRSFTLPASVQVQRQRFKRLNRSFAMLGTASTVVALLLLVLIASDTLFSFLGIPANTATHMAAPLMASSAPSAGTVATQSEPAPTQPEPASTQSEPAATSEGAAVLVFTPTEEPAATVPTQDNALPPSETAMPTESAVSKLAAAPQATPTPEQAGVASIDTIPADTITPTTPKSLAVERSAATSAAATPEEPSATRIPPAPTFTPSVTATAVPPSPTATQPAPTATPVTPSPTATVPEATGTPVEVAAVVAATPPAEAATLAPVEISWTEQPLWWVWRGVRIAAYISAGLLCILLAGLLWTGYRRRL